MSPNLTVVEDSHVLSVAPLVSVCIVTYNQESFIGDALDSVLKQDVEFPYEIVVGDDGSTDGTTSVLRSYQQAHPDRIRLNLHETNNGGIPARVNMVTNLRAARGKYVALLDGDDYWVSPDKLSRQTAFLESHPKISFSFHDSILDHKVEETDKTIQIRFSSEYLHDLAQDRLFSKRELVYGLSTVSSFSIPAASVMYRRRLFDPIPQWFWKVWNADKAMQLHFVTHGKAYYHSDLVSYYRYRNPSSMKVRYRNSWQRNDIHLRQIPVFCQIVSDYKQYADWEYYLRYRTRTLFCLRKGAYRDALWCFIRGVYHYLRSLARGHCPKIH